MAPEGQQCPPQSPVPCSDGSTVPAGQKCPSPSPVLCSDGSTVPAGQQCPPQSPIQCPDGWTVAAGQQCREPNSDLPLWLALIGVAVIVAGVATALLRSRLIARTRQLLGLRSSLDPSGGEFDDTEMALHGPPIVLRARLDLEET
jgi:hypothetical protein